MKTKKNRKKLFFYFILFVGFPLLFLGIAEGIIRIAGINTEIVKSDEFNIGVPMWAMDEANLAIARDVYAQILDNNLPAESAEWLECFEEAPHVHYRMKRRYSALVSNTVNRIELQKGIKVYMQSNSIGFRTKEIPKKKGDSTYRIFVLGDSTSFGWGVNQDERFSEQLETRLNSVQETVAYEIYNFGIPGYTSLHAKELFDHFVLKYEPDMVILTFGANDSRRVPLRVKRILKQSSFVEGAKDFLGKFKTYRLLRKVVVSLFNPLERVRKTASAEEEEEEFVTPWEYQQNLEYIIRKGKERHIETVLLGLCCPIEYLAKMMAVGEREGVRSIDGMHILLQELPCIQSGECYKRLSLFYKNLYGEQVLKDRRILYVTSDTCHPNRLGHEIIGEALFQRVFKTRIDPSD
ncbi:SGNH/GDSL hydrolase family protein [Acidobacteriota bacterium]